MQGGMKTGGTTRNITPISMGHEDKDIAGITIRESPFELFPQPQQTLKHPATIITESKSDTTGQTSRMGLPRAGSSWDGRKRSWRDDEVELHNIRVETIQTVEIEKRRSESKSSADGDEWVGSAKRVIGERIV